MIDLDNDLLQRAQSMGDLDVAFIKAVAAGDLSRIKTLVAKGAQLLHYDEYPIRLASGSGHLDVVQYLLDAGADPRSFLGQLALAEAAEHGHLLVVQHLLSAGANVSANHELPLRMALWNGHTDIVKVLLNSGARFYIIGEANGRGSKIEALARAAENGHLELVQFLLSTGEASPDEQKKAIRLAAEKGHVAVVQYLLTAVGDREIDARLLRSAATSGSQAVFRCLLEAGANRKSLQLVLPDLPPDMQKLVVSTGKPWQIAVEKCARKGVCSEAIRILLQRQGKKDLAAMLQATQLLEPLTPDARAEMLEVLLAKQTHPGVAHAGPV